MKQEEEEGGSGDGEGGGDGHNHKNKAHVRLTASAPVFAPHRYAPATLPQAAPPTVRRYSHRPLGGCYSMCMHDMVVGCVMAAASQARHPLHRAWVMHYGKPETVSNEWRPNQIVVNTFDTVRCFAGVTDVVVPCVCAWP